VSDAGRPDGERLTLEVVAGRAVGTTVEVDDRIVFGRQSTGDGQLAGDTELSRSHAEIVRDASGGFRIVDLSSTNGTYVNRERVQGQMPLTLGDIVDIGTSRLVVRSVPAPTATDDADPRDQTVILRVPPDMRAGASERTPPIELHLTIDTEQGEARIALGSDSDVVTMRRTGGRWTLAAG
jgi:pSer/pThr/pTyr-binding forkhead associated (FHA) protein